MLVMGALGSLNASSQTINQLMGKVRASGTWFNFSVTLGCPLGHTVYPRQVDKHREGPRSESAQEVRSISC